jgi:hypothetical protein
LSGEPPGAVDRGGQLVARQVFDAAGFVHEHIGLGSIEKHADMFEMLGADLRQHGFMQIIQRRLDRHADINDFRLRRGRPVDIHSGSPSADT